MHLTYSHAHIYTYTYTDTRAWLHTNYTHLIYSQAQEDEKTLYHGEWAHDLSLDHPNYGSIFLQIKEANSEADGSYEFIRKTGDIISNTRELRS